MFDKKRYVGQGETPRGSLEMTRNAKFDRSLSKVEKKETATRQKQGKGGENRENSLTQPFYHIDPKFGVRKGKVGLQITYITNMLMMTYRWQNMLKKN